MYLEPLGERAMGEIVDGLVEGLPEAARAALVERSEGIPVYALEMVRALIDRDAVIPRDGRYVVAPDAEEHVDLATLDAPPSLQALIAARLDALTPDERRLVQEATAHGFAFSRDGIEATSTVADLDAVLRELVRKEIFELHTDRFSAEHGQYRFVQALVRTVAYDTLSRRDRKARHLRWRTTSRRPATATRWRRSSLGTTWMPSTTPPMTPMPGTWPPWPSITSSGPVGEQKVLGSADEALRHYTTALERDPPAGDRARLLEGAARTAHVHEPLGRGGRPRGAGAGRLRVDGDSRSTRLAWWPCWARSCSTSVHLQAAFDLMAPVYERLQSVPDADDAILPLADSLARAHVRPG